MVLGILLAFQIEELRISRAERLMEVANLEAVLIDLDRRETTTKQVIKFAEETQQGVSEFISMMQYSQPLDGNSYLTSKLRSSNNWLWERSRLFDNGYFSSENMSLVSDSKLRDILYNYYMGSENYLDQIVTSYNASFDESKINLLTEFRYVPADNFSNTPEFIWRIRDSDKPFPSNPDFVQTMGTLYSRAGRIIAIAERINLNLTGELRPALEKHLADIR